jgi:hypothetical protein
LISVKKFGIESGSMIRSLNFTLVCNRWQMWIQVQEWMVVYLERGTEAATEAFESRAPSQQLQVLRR